MKTSVVISTYNGQRYLLDQLKSIRDQTLAVDEVLIADDCSTDDTVAIAQQFIDDNHLAGWRIEVNEHNKGWRRNFMEAMWQSQGDLVFPCDQDDIWRSDKVEKMVEIMDKHPEINVLVSNYQRFFPDGKTDIGPHKNDKQLAPVSLSNNYLSVDYPGCAYLVRRIVLNWAKSFWQEDFAHDDTLWRLGLMSSSLYAIHDDLHHWRMHHDSTFAIEARDLKSIPEKKKWIRIANNMNSSLISFVKEYQPPLYEKKISILKRNAKWLKLRKTFYEKRNCLSGLRLMPYWDCYPRKRQYLGDWYIIFVKRK